MQTISTVLIISLGGALGATFRYFSVKGLNTWLPGFPLGILTVNIIGSLLLGLILYTTINGKHLPEAWRLFLAIGFLGSLTTMSTFALDSTRFLETGEILKFGLNIFLNVFLSLLAVIAGRELALLFSS